MTIIKKLGPTVQHPCPSRAAELSCRRLQSIDNWRETVTESLLYDLYRYKTMEVIVTLTNPLLYVYLDLFRY